MSTDIQTIITGQDPRGLPEFSAMREEINKASHPAQPEMNWTLVESLALTIFKSNGVDLHTASYYTLARTRTQGLAGFCEGVELLAALIGREWDKFWPQGGARARKCWTGLTPGPAIFCASSWLFPKRTCRCCIAWNGRCR
ncbi:hypothetical protein LTSEWAN_1620 [Salmonella enterica subsp. enterica serovar Wandsworth str. A4-580]|uniref:ImpA N-terminal domain-containing protein n=1 Tax=Salmonella enterica subsp. enterica serovar Wandsworth str. A4-580 TaxID=913086 RepID=G5S9G9_SALET|nr:hypothetical protein LTSEWAN_1620 [Salmonella enterica subsp. enterica serovar Wandsworth str. A4-580]